MAAGRSAGWEVCISKILAPTLGDTVSIQVVAKDLDLATKLADSAAGPLPVAQVALAQYRDAAGRGHDARDIGQLAEGLGGMTAK